MSAKREKKIVEKTFQTCQSTRRFEPILFREDLRDTMFLDWPKTNYFLKMFSELTKNDAIYNDVHMWTQCIHTKNKH